MNCLFCKIPLSITHCDYSSSFANYSCDCCRGKFYLFKDELFKIIFNINFNDNKYAFYFFYNFDDFPNFVSIYKAINDNFSILIGKFPSINFRPDNLESKLKTILTFL